MTKEYIINNFFNNKGNLNSNKIKNINIPNEYNWCDSKSEYLYAIINNTSNKPKCKICSNFVSYISNGNYKIYCSSICASKDKEIQNKRLETNIQKYGTKNPIENKTVYNKMIENNINKYGVEHFTQSKEYKEKIINTNNLKYGKDYIFQTEEYKSNLKSENLEKYGVEHITQTNFQKEKSKITKLEKYGNMNFNNVKKSKETFLNKYGVDHIMKNKSFCKNFILKREENNFNKNNVYHFSQNHLTNVKDLNKEFIEKRFIDKDYYLDIDNYCKYFNFTINTAYVYLRNLNIEYKRKNLIEKEINLLFNNIFIERDRKLLNGLELDLLNDKIAIEYNGLMYHSFGMSKINHFNNVLLENKEYMNNYKHKERHLMKTNLCEEKNIKLFHIFENEWLNSTKKEIWISMINNSLNNNNSKIFARKCIIKELKSKNVYDFLETNHIQGFINSSINIGLYYNDKLVSLMTFGKSRDNKNYEYELYRFCNILNTNVVGAFSKILNYFEKKYKPKSIISYGNRRWTNTFNNVYNKNNFELINITTPNYFYFKGMKFESRKSFQKHRLKEKLDIYDTNLNSNTNIYLNGYRKIYDSGNLVYVKRYNY